MRAPIMLKLFIKILLFCLPLGALAHGSESYPFVENQGQWDQRIEYNITLPDGSLFLEKGGFTYHLMDRSYFKSLHSTNPKPEPEFMKSHGLFLKFVNSNPNVKLSPEKPSEHYYNYLIGHSSNHQTHVKAYQKVLYDELYSGIDLAVYHTDYGFLKYDYIVGPGANAQLIKTSYDGADELYLKNGHLVVQTSITQIVEQAPFAYQIINGEKVEVSCKFKLKDGVLSYKFPRGYDETIELVIDPILIFSSFTGSSADNFGFTATYDNSENTYVGGIVFGVGVYPTTPGAFQTAFAGVVTGITDIGISKFNSDGTALLYSTYIGGTGGSEAPHSLVVNDNNELYILGTSASSDYPVTPTAFQSIYVGGPTVTPQNSGMNYVNGADIVVSRLSADGTTLLSSTFFGGTGSDGLNMGDSLAYNYGDPFRGEIIIDAAGNPVIATTTNSLDFPVSPGCPQPVYGGGDSDGCAFRLSADLSTMLWSTYIGGSGEDSGYGIQLNSTGDMYITGGTTSQNLNISASAHHSSHAGGVDGYVVRYNSAGNLLLSSTFLGTTEYDQAYFVQVDVNDDVYVVGQTTGPYMVTASAYNNPNSGQFIQKYTPNLTGSVWSTVVGTGSGNVDFSPSAFLVNDCGLIYISGWGGSLAGLGSYQADFSTTTGLPVTTTGANAAFQSTTDGSDFYLMVLNADAAGLLYGTFFGGGISSEHVDGGTSRFDKNGIVYQAVCAGCGGNSDFPTTPGVWSNTNNSTNCNLGAFKFGLGNINTSISIPLPYVCIPSSYQFFNNSVGGNMYHWDFGDGDTSIVFEPSHDYLDTGHYFVTLIVADSTGCIQPDTAVIELDVYAIGNAQVQPITPICPGDSTLLMASGGATYQWLPNTDLSHPTAGTTWAFPPITTDYMVIATDSCGIDTALITVTVFNPVWTVDGDTTVCGGIPVPLNATGGASYSWEPAALMIGANTGAPIITTFDTTTAIVTIITIDGCEVIDSVIINTINSVPIPILTADTAICLGDPLTIIASSNADIEFISPVVANPFDSIQVVQPVSNTTYVVSFTNQCGVVFDSTVVQVMYINPIVSPDTIICPGDTADLRVSGGTIYSWTPTSTIAYPDSSNTPAWPDSPTTYTVTVSTNNGCTKNINVTVGLHPLPYVHAGEDQFITFGSETQLNGVASVTDSTFWTSIDTLSCYLCLDPTVFPMETTDYIIHTFDVNGCENVDTVTVFLDGTLYVPNAFSPNGDGKNDYFVVMGEEIVKFKMRVFDRWGLQIFYSENMNFQWDGKFKGDVVQIDTYVWKIEYEDSWGRLGTLIGHVSVIR
jgi:gliding motility-associated-like protein